MRVLYHQPSTETVYAGRTIYNGYKHAFIDLGHEWRELTADDDAKTVFDSYQPDLFITSLHPYYLRYLDTKDIIRRRGQGLKVAVNVAFWEQTFSALRLNEVSGLVNSPGLVSLIKDGLGDIYYNSLAQSDRRMAGFKKGTGQDYVTIPLAVDKIALDEAVKQDRFVADIAYVGTYLPQKRRFFAERVFPLRRKYRVRLYGQDWTAWSRAVGLAAKVGQYYNLAWLKKIQKPALKLEEEGMIYASTRISINVHEDYQKELGGDCNERTFKIPFCHGFEITDDVSCIRDYMREGSEIVIARDRDDWFDKIDYYMKRPDERRKISEAGRERVLRDHTYHARVAQMLTALGLDKQVQ